MQDSNQASEMLEKVKGIIPMHHGRPEGIAGLCVHLAPDAAVYASGEFLPSTARKALVQPQ